MMTIIEARKRKRELEQNILELLNNFTLSTTLIVDRVELFNTQEFGETSNRIINVNVDVKLDR